MSSVEETRRTKGSGSVFQRANGRWVATKTLGYSRSGRRLRRTVYGLTKAEVEEKLGKLNASIEKQRAEARRIKKATGGGCYVAQQLLGGPIKIGLACDDVERLKGHQTSNSEPILILAFTEQNRERELHERFNHLRKMGEWFWDTQELIDCIVSEFGISEQIQDHLLRQPRATQETITKWQLEIADAARMLNLA